MHVILHIIIGFYQNKRPANDAPHPRAFHDLKCKLDSIDTVIPCASAVMYKHPSWRDVKCNHPCDLSSAISLLLRRQQGSIEMG